MVYATAALLLVSRGVRSHEEYFASLSVKMRRRAHLIQLLLITLWAAGITDLLLRTTGLTGAERGGAAEIVVMLVRVLAILVLAWYSVDRQIWTLLGSDTVEEARAEESRRYRNSAIDDALAGDVQRRLEAVMETDKPFLDPLISLDALASRLRIKPAILTQVLNVHMGTGFFAFVNQHRIEAAKQRLIADPAASIADIAFEVGYNSRSTFYAAFKSACGCTPSAYRAAWMDAATEVQGR